jgi:hypothetical protein
MYEYKLLTERDSKFSGNFDAESLEAALNSYATQGWRVTNGFLANSLWKSGRSDIVVILERELPTTP